MASSGFLLLSEDQLLCSICLDVFTNPTTIPCGHNYCADCIRQHYGRNKGVRQCPLCKRVFTHQHMEMFVNRVLSEMADQLRSTRRRDEYVRKSEAKLEQLIRERREKIQEVQDSAQLSKKKADREIADSVQALTALVASAQRSQAELVDAIEGKQKATEKQAEGIVKALEQEIETFEERGRELRRLSTHTGDRPPKNFASIDDTPLPAKEWWRKVNVRPALHVGAARTAMAQLERTLRQETEKVNEAELRSVQQYAVDVTLDPDTAYWQINLSGDRKQATRRLDAVCVTVHKQSFTSCIAVLGKQGFSSGRFYFEVQVRGKVEWDLGVARESINRKQSCVTVRPNYGYWAIRLRDGNEYTVPGTLTLSVRGAVRKVGVFVDYEEGLVSFYDVQARVHLYSYTGCTFSETLFPFFYVGSEDEVPMIISPVRHN